MRIRSLKLGHSRGNPEFRIYSYLIYLESIRYQNLNTGKIFNEIDWIVSFLYYSIVYLFDIFSFFFNLFKIIFYHVVKLQILLCNRINADRRQLLGEIYIFQSPIMHISESEGDNYVLKVPLTLERCEYLHEIFIPRNFQTENFRFS